MAINNAGHATTGNPCSRSTASPARLSEAIGVEAVEPRRRKAAAAVMSTPVIAADLVTDRIASSGAWNDASLAKVA